MIKDDLHAFLRSRRSIRRFKSDPVSLDCIQRILETGIYAPSAHNLQPWRFAVITSNAAKKLLAETITGRFRQDMVIEGVPEADIQARVNRTVRRTIEAPVIIVLCRDTPQVKWVYNQWLWLVCSCCWLPTPMDWGVAGFVGRSTLPMRLDAPWD